MAEEVCVSEIWSHTFINVTIVDSFEDEADGFSCCSIVMFDKADEDIKRVHDEAVGFPSVVSSD